MIKNNSAVTIKPIIVVILVLLSLLFFKTSLVIAQPDINQSETHSVEELLENQNATESDEGLSGQVLGDESLDDEARESTEHELEETEVKAEDLLDPSSQMILRRERLTKEIQDQRTQLLGQLAEYQQDERRYRVALDQFRRLQTLSSIEEVTAASKRLILSRNLVLNSYLNLLRLKVVESEGIESRHKSRVIERLENLQKELSDHSDRAEEVSDRQEINLLAEDFEPLSDSIAETSHYALSVLAVGRLQSVYDQSAVVSKRIIQKQEEEQAETNTARARAFSEVDRLMNDLPPIFLSVWTKVDQAEDSRLGYQSLYRGLASDLNIIYSRLSRLVAYFEELENVR